MAFNADLLKKKLKEEGKSRNELAAAIKKHKRTIHRWLDGTNPPKPKDLEAIARVLNCEPKYFDPFFADIGLGEVSIQAHVSVASHNAYELMRWGYGVSQKQIMELAPILFAIVAQHALKVPDQDDALEQMAVVSGRGSTQMIGDQIDRQASKRKQCFGLASPDPYNVPSRNLFDIAIRRLSVQVVHDVDTERYVGANRYLEAEPGDAPGASGCLPDTRLLKKITCNNWELIESIVNGRVRLSAILQNAKEGNKRISNEEITKAIRQAHVQSSGEQQKASIKKLKAWRAFYAERHPDMAVEYDHIVAQHCHAEGWCPSWYKTDYHFQSLADPFREDRHINTDTLVEYQRLTAVANEEGRFSPGLEHQDPVFFRYSELKHHRDQLKKQFEEAWA